MLQGITVATFEVFQVMPLLIFTVVGKFLDTTPRAKYDRWSTLSSISWGDTYPKLTNLAVIGKLFASPITTSANLPKALAYSCIAPLTLWFATIGLGLLYLAFRYNVFYTVSTAVDTKGNAYGRALQHLTVGIYLAELCFIGLFSANGGKGPAQLMVLFFIISVTYQIYLNWVLNPLLNSLSDKLLADEEQEALTAAGMENGESNETGPSIASLINDNLGTSHAVKQSRWSLHRERGGYFARYLFHGSKSPYPELRAKLSSAFPANPFQRSPRMSKSKLTCILQSRQLFQHYGLRRTDWVSLRNKPRRFSLELRW
jgi:hypothetical protein